MRKILTKGVAALHQAGDKLAGEFSAGLQVVRKIVNGLPVVMSVERQDDTAESYDEKHYFVIPYHLSETGFYLHTLRSLPRDALQINNLPKRRVFHLPGEHYEASLREHMLVAAKGLVLEKHRDSAKPLEKLADDIDKLDSKLTYGMLAIGGVAAIFNPLLGAGIAAKAMIPGVAGLLNKHGLKPLGEKLNQRQLESRAKQAEDNVLKQFSAANTLKVINPILQELDLALRTDQSQHDPLFDPLFSQQDIPELRADNWRVLTIKSLQKVYSEVLPHADKCEQANLGPEDIRWLKTLFNGLEQ